MSSLRNKLAGKTTKLAKPRKRLEDHPANLQVHDGGFCLIEIDQISPDPEQPRKYFSKKSLGELAQSVKQKGILQPIIIRRDVNGKIWLVAGERRFRAAQIAGVKKIPAIVSTGNPAEIALIENLQREDLKPIEEAEGYQRIIQTHGYKQDELAKIVGKARSTVSEVLALTRLPDNIRKECRTSDIPKNVLLEIAKQPDKATMNSLFDRAQKSNFTVTTIRQLTRTKPTKKKNPSHHKKTIQQIKKLTTSMVNLDAEKLTSNEKAEIITELQNLIDASHRILAAAD